MRSILLGFISLFIFGHLSSLDAASGPGGVGTTEGNSSLILWLRVDSLSLTNGDPVTTWSDESGYNHHLIQTNVDRQPTFAAQGMGIHPTLRFSDDFFESVTLPFPVAEITYIAVLKPEKRSAYYPVFEREEGARPMIWIDPSNQYEFNYGTTPRPPAGEGFDIIAGAYSSSRQVASVLFLNSANPAGTSTTTFSIPTSAPFTFFKRTDRGFHGEIAELILYNRRLSDQDISKVLSYLKAKYSGSTELEPLRIYSQAHLLFNKGTLAEPVKPTPYHTGGLSYSISEPPPEGVQFDSSTGIFSGTPTELRAPYTVVVSATNTLGETTSADVTLEVAEANTDLVITEVVSKNLDNITDGYGELPDWIEIFNAGSSPVNLHGWALTDKANNLRQCLLPAYHIQPGEYLVVFASDHTGFDPAGYIHVPMGLSGSGEYLALTDTSGTVISAPSFPALPSNVSFGTPDFGATYGIYNRPTPGAANPALSPSGLELTVSPGAKVFAETLNLTIEGQYSGPAVIRYTLDGTAPTESSPVYTTPIPLTAHAKVRAAYIRPGYDPGPTAAANYLKVDDTLKTFKSNLPVFFLRADSTILPRTSTSRTPTTVFAFENDDIDGKTDLLNTPHFAARGGLRIRGRSSSLFPQKQYNFHTWGSEFVREDFPLLGLPSQSKWALYAPWSDKAIVRNAFTYSLWEQLGHPSLKFRFAEVFLDEGLDTEFNYAKHYAGIYMLVERPSLSVIGISGPQGGPSNITGGFVTEHGGLDDSHFTTGYSGRTVAHKHEDPDEEDINADQIAWIKNFMEEMEKAIYGADFHHPNGNHYSAYLNVPSHVDYAVVREWSRNFDGGSAYSHLPRAGKHTMGPLWDYNWAYGNVNYAEGGDLPAYRTDGWNISYTADINGWAPYWARLWEDPTFLQSFIDRWAELRRTLLSDSAVENSIRSLTDPLAIEAANRHFARWPQLGSNTGVSAPGFESRTTFESEVVYMINFLANRSFWIDSQFITTPEASLPSGPISPRDSLAFSALSQPHVGDPVDVYYTTDGTDPRQTSGLPSPSAKRLRPNESFSVTEAISITARGYDGERWGPPYMGSYSEGPNLAKPGDLYLAHYDEQPEPPSADDLTALPGITSDDFSFFTLRNRSDAEIVLSEYKIKEGITAIFAENFKLAPGAICAIVRNPDAFRLRHGDSIPIAAIFSSKLSQIQTAEIQISTPSDAVILQVALPKDLTAIVDQGGYFLAYQLPESGDLTDRSAWHLVSSFSQNDLAKDYTLWAISHYSDEAIQAGEANPEAVPPGGVSTNLVRFALGKSPADEVNRPIIDLSEDGRTFTYTYSIAKNCVGISHHVQISYDLKNWAPVTEPTLELDETETHRTYSVSVSAENRDLLFMRLAVTIPD